MIMEGGHMHAYLKRGHSATPLAHMRQLTAASALHCLGPQGLNNVRKVYAYMARVRGAMYVSIYDSSERPQTEVLIAIKDLN